MRINAVKSKYGFLYLGLRLGESVEADDDEETDDEVNSRCKKNCIAKVFSPISGNGF
jgi:hypothetical protein